MRQIRAVIGATTSAGEISARFTINAAGDLFFNKQPVDTAHLEEALKELLAQNAEPRVFINGDTKAEFGKAIAVLDEVRKLGITKVAIETQPAPAPSPAAP